MWCSKYTREFMIVMFFFNFKQKTKSGENFLIWCLLLWQPKIRLCVCLYCKLTWDANVSESTLNYFASILPAVSCPAVPCLTLTFGQYLIVPLRNRRVACILQLQFFESSVNGVHELPVTSHYSDYIKCRLKCLVCVMQIVKSGDLMIFLNLKSMDCMDWQVGMSTLWGFYVFNSVTCHVLIHWTFTGPKEKMSHVVFGGFFFHCNVGSVMAMPKICWCNFCCQCFESERGENSK